MSSKIDFLQNNLNAALFDSYNKNVKNETNIPNYEFSNILSNQIGMKSLLPASQYETAGASDLNMIMMMLLVKLLGASLDINQNTVEGDLPSGNPVNGRITQGSHAGHVALDYGVPVGTEIHSTMSGKVIFAGWNNEGYGNLVILENGDYKTYYAHLSEIPVKKGQIVDEGEVVGISGNTGNSTGPHLHYEIRKNNQAINPLITL